MQVGGVLLLGAGARRLLLRLLVVASHHGAMQLHLVGFSGRGSLLRVEKVRRTVEADLALLENLRECRLNVGGLVEAERGAR